MAYNVKFLKGTLDAYNAIVANQTLDLNTFYFVGEDDLYLGDIKLSNAKDLENAIKDITANAEEIEAIQAELGALTGNDSENSINEMITIAVSNLKNELNPKIEANTTAIEGLTTRIDELEENADTTMRGFAQSITTNTNNIAANTTHS